LKEEVDQATGAGEEKRDDNPVQQTEVRLLGMTGDERRFHILAALPADFESKGAHAAQRSTPCAMPVSLRRPQATPSFQDTLIVPESRDVTVLGQRPTSSSPAMAY
jgi:hypothetical protein